MRTKAGPFNISLEEIVGETNIMEKGLGGKVSYEVNLNVNEAVRGILSMGGVLDSAYQSMPTRTLVALMEIEAYDNMGPEPKLVRKTEYALAFSN